MVKSIIKRVIPMKRGGKIPLFIIGLAAVGLFFLLKKKNNSISKQGSSLSNVSYSENNLTIDKNELNLAARSIYDAMNRAGTDEKTIFDEFEKIENNDDFKYLIIKFGEPKYFGLGFGNFGTPMNLKGWLQRELSKIGKYSYDNLKALLEKKGINYL